MRDSELTNELLEFEHAGWKSLCDGSGDAFYGNMMTDAAVMVLANGAVLDRDAVTAALGQSPPWARYEISEVRLIEIAPDTAALVYTGTGWRDDTEPFVGAMSSVYHRGPDGWKLMLYQQSAKG
ncbi:nuclear transport factor 2 family protein [[Mycobacterium] burgundiense]|uniref:Nuclear transport factor 2 family protein n=1 Tax=[Mycobacterium] burgundiense TaxID=3064286 RepID=A0ABN9NKM8_9MYCO|nr:nuclear transport factor 2 family protein [Mycolicibacterium sp. MU0053]CAJ1508040.1 nuclear transport factor 2 family protein [Mycolicibacterium sp. MU0053]